MNKEIEEESDCFIDTILPQHIIYQEEPDAVKDDSIDSFKPITDKASYGLDVNSDSNSLRELGLSTHFGTVKDPLTPDNGINAPNLM